MPCVSAFTSLTEQKSFPTCWVCSRYKPRILLEDGSHRNLSSTFISSIMRTYPHPSSPCEPLKAACRLHWISSFEGVPTEGDSGTRADPHRSVDTAGPPSDWCARLATRAPPSHKKSNPRNISSSVKFFGLYNPFCARSSISSIPRTPTPWFIPA